MQSEDQNIVMHLIWKRVSRACSVKTPEDCCIFVQLLHFFLFRLPYLPPLAQILQVDGRQYPMCAAALKYGFNVSDILFAVHT
jgi:hypothetical protein